MQMCDTEIALHIYWDLQRKKLWFCLKAVFPFHNKNGEGDKNAYKKAILLGC